MKGLLAFLFFLSAASVSAQVERPPAAPQSLADSAAVLPAWTGDEAALALPVRRFSERAALLPRVRTSGASDTLFVRGIPLRSVFFGGHAAGVHLALPQTATAGVRAFVGDVPARYGDILGAALVADAARPDLQRFSVTTEALRTVTGGEATAGRLALSVPVWPGRLALRLDVEGEAEGEVEREGLRVIAPEARARIAARPTVLVGSAGAETVVLGLPAGIPDGTPLEALLADPAGFGLDVPPGTVLGEGQVAAATDFLSDEDFVTIGRLGEHREGQVYGALRARPVPALTFDLAGQWGGVERDVISPFLTPLNPGLLPREAFEARRLFGTARVQAGRLNARADVSVGTERRLLRPAGFSGDVRDAIRYGLPREAGTFYRQGFGGDDVTLSAVADPFRPQGLFGLASAVGFGGGLYDRAESEHARAALQSRIRVGRFGIRHVEAGMEWKAATHRRYRLDASGLARRADEEGVEQYEALEPVTVRPALYYGFDRRGLAASSVSDSTQEGIGTDSRRAPYRPRYWGGFAEGTGVWGPLRMRAGVRVVRAAADGLEAAFQEETPDFGSPVERFRGAVTAPVEWAVLPRLRADVSAGPVALYAYYARFARQPDPAFYQPVEAFYGTAASSIGYRALRLERANEAGLGVRWHQVSGEKVYTAEGRVYQRRLENSEGLRRVTVGGQDIFRGVDDDPLGFDVTLGLDVDASGRWGRRLARVAYAYARVEDRTWQPTGSPRELQRSPADGSGFFPDLRPHQADVQAGVLAGDGSGLLDRLSVIATGRYASGRLYNAVALSPGLTSGFLGAVERTTRTPALYELDLQAAYVMTVRGSRVTAFALLQNVLDRRTPVRVYTASGEAGTDGFLETDGGMVFPLPALYRAALADPSHYAPGRQVRVGLRVTG